jgi:hypothetical protein
VIRWGAAGLFGVVLLPVVAAVALFGSGNCSTSVSAPGAATKTASQIVQYFVSQGFTVNAAAGVVGNLQQESGLNPSEAGGGLAQWNPGWYAQMAAFATSQGLSPSSMAGQVAYLAWDLHGPYAGLLAQLNAASSPSIAALLFMDGYEQCSGAGPNGGIDFVSGSLCNAPARQRYAEAAAGGGGGGTPVSAGPACATAGTVTPGTTATILPDGSASVPAGAPPAVAAAIGAGNEIHTMPYSMPEGSPAQHYGPLSTPWPAYDCSGSASFVLWRAGLHAVTADVSGSLGHWGLPGPGRWITVYANSSHVWVVVGGIAFDTSHYSPAVPASPGPRWQSNPTGNLRDGLSYVQRHPAGL